jgi:hypothetical protein
MPVVDWLRGFLNRPTDISEATHLTSATIINKVSTITYLSAELIEQPCVTSDKTFNVDETNKRDNPKGQSQILSVWCSDLCRGGELQLEPRDAALLEELPCLLCLFSLGKRSSRNFK